MADQVTQPTGYNVPIPGTEPPSISVDTNSIASGQPIFSLNPEEGFRHTSAMLTPAGGLEMSSDVRQQVEMGSSLVEDNSYVLLQGKAKELVQLNGGNVTLKATGDVWQGGQNFFKSIAGDSQTVIQGSEYSYVQGDRVTMGGDATEEKVQAAKDAQKIASEIDKKKMDTIKNTKGSETECPTCAQEVLTDRGQCLLDLIFKLIRLAIPNFPYPLDILQSLLNFLGVPMESPETVKQLNGGEGCGSPGCKNGKITTPQEGIQQANKQAADDLKSKQKQLAEHQKKMGSGGTQVMGPFTGDVALYVGHPEAMNMSPTVALKEPDVIPFGHTNEKSGKGFIPNSKGNCKKAVYSDPLILPGSFTLGVGQKLTIKSGSPGVEVKTSGLMNLVGSMTTVTASEGELVMMSNNVTKVKGKNIIIDAEDLSGDSGIYMDAKSVKCTGALAVDGDLSVKGHISMDGGITTTHITCPGERVASGPSGAAHQVHSGGNWNNPTTGLQATVFDQFDKSWKKVSRDIFNVLSLNIINGMAEIKTLIEETYSTLMLNTIIDNTFMPTGFGTTFFAQPGVPAGPPLMVNGVAFAMTKDGPAPVVFQYTFVVPGQTLPVYTFTHNHGSPGGNHSHDYTSFQGDPVGTNTAARANRPNPSHVPSPAKSTGIGTKPGHKNTGDLCIPCIWPFGGGGPNAAKRNSSYGIDPNLYNNVYNGTNYVNVSAVNMDSDGNLVPPPSLDLGC
jgi:hypothetical protein